MCLFETHVQITSRYKQSMDQKSFGEDQLLMLSESPEFSYSSKGYFGAICVDFGQVFELVKWYASFKKVFYCVHKCSRSILESYLDKKIFGPVIPSLPTVLSLLFFFFSITELTGAWCRPMNSASILRELLQIKFLLENVTMNRNFLESIKKL